MEALCASPEAPRGGEFSLEHLGQGKRSNHVVTWQMAVWIDWVDGGLTLARYGRKSHGKSTRHSVSAGKVNVGLLGFAETNIRP